jgi:hypothetical protein
MDLLSFLIEGLVGLCVILLVLKIVVKAIDSFLE